MLFFGRYNSTKKNSQLSAVVLSLPIIFVGPQQFEAFSQNIIKCDKTIGTIWVWKSRKMFQLNISTKHWKSLLVDQKYLTAQPARNREACDFEARKIYLQIFDEIAVTIASFLEVILIKLNFDINVCFFKIGLQILNPISTNEYAKIGVQIYKFCHRFLQVMNSKTAKSIFSCNSGLENVSQFLKAVNLCFLSSKKIDSLYKLMQAQPFSVITALKNIKNIKGPVVNYKFKKWSNWRPQ